MLHQLAFRLALSLQKDKGDVGNIFRSTRCFLARARLEGLGDIVNRLTMEITGLCTLIMDYGGY